MIGKERIITNSSPLDDNCSKCIHFIDWHELLPEDTFWIREAGICNVFGVIDGEYVTHCNICNLFDRIRNE